MHRRAWPLKYILLESSEISQGPSPTPSPLRSVTMIRGTVLAFAVSIASVLGALYQEPTQEVLNSTYDFIIVGGTSCSRRLPNDKLIQVFCDIAGAGGAVMASRLSEDPDMRILLIEAGGRYIVILMNIWEQRNVDFALTYSGFGNLNISVPGRASTLPRSEFVRAPN